MKLSPNEPGKLLATKEHEKKEGSIVYMHNDIFLIIYNYCLTHQSQYQLYIQT